MDNSIADQRFFQNMGLVLFSLVLLGFGAAAFARGLNPLDLPVLFHVHAVTYLLWFALFLVQASLIRTNNRDLHRALGKLSPWLVIAMLVTGWMMAKGTFERGVSPIPDISIEQFMAFPVFDLIGLLVFFSLAYLKRSVADFHKRAMLLALVAIMDPATARLGMTLGVPPFPLVASVLLVGSLMWHDRKTLSRVQLITWFGFVWIFLRVGFVFGFASSDAWARIAISLFE